MFWLYFGSRTYLFLPDEGYCYIFSTRNNCCKSLASCGVVIQSVIQSHVSTFFFFSVVTLKFQNLHRKRTIICTHITFFQIIKLKCLSVVLIKASLSKFFQLFKWYVNWNFFFTLLRDGNSFRQWKSGVNNKKTAHLINKGTCIILRHSS